MILTGATSRVTVWGLVPRSEGSAEQADGAVPERARVAAIRMAGAHLVEELAGAGAAPQRSLQVEQILARLVEDRRVVRQVFVLVPAHHRAWLERGDRVERGEPVPQPGAADLQQHLVHTVV